MPFSSWIDQRKADSKTEPRELTKDNSLELNMNSTSPKSSLAKIGLHPKPKPFRILILGTSGVGKTAMVVRFITRRFIGEYDPNLEKVYSFSTIMDNEAVLFEILDAKSGQLNESDNANLESNIRWADAFILMYSVTDKCSFDECNRLKFLINYNKRRKKIGSNGKDNSCDVPVMLVANKIDQYGDRMVLVEDGQRRYREIGCVGFREISVRESIEQVWGVFHDICQMWQVFSKCPKLKRSTSEVQTSAESIVSPESTICSIFDNTMRVEKRRSFLIGNWTERSPDECDEGKGHDSHSNGKTDGITPFRERASTDGTIFSRPRRWHYPARVSVVSHPSRIERRMSISMRGSNASY